LEPPSIGLAEEKRSKGKAIKANYVFQHFSNVDLATRKCPLGKITKHLVFHSDIMVILVNRRGS
jgi:hypothetical protein